VYLADHIRDELHLKAKEQAAASGGIPSPKCIAGRAAPGHATTIVENGTVYHVALANGSATGLYLDQRANRKKLVELISKLPPSPKGRIMLNAFSYTGSFSVAACLGVPGLQTLNLDPSTPATEIAIKNFESNKLDAGKHKFQSKDVFASMTALDNVNAQFDVVVVDPPTVLRVRRPDGKLFTFSTLSNYNELTSLAAPLVAPGGLLVAFMNTRTLDAEKWEKDVQKGIDSIVDRKKELFEFLNFAETRKKLRKRPDLRKKPRDRLLRQMASDGKFEITRDDIEKMYSFTKIDQWTQDVDFGWHESDPAGQYLHGLVFQRSSYIPNGIKIPPSPPLVTETRPPAKKNKK
jgi:predicted RNA methylase